MLKSFDKYDGFYFCTDCGHGYDHQDQLHNTPLCQCDPFLKIEAMHCGCQCFTVAAHREAHKPNAQAGCTCDQHD